MRIDGIVPGIFCKAYGKIPVLIPDSRESGRESGSLRTASTAINL
jgi:hypothetical protein